MNLEYFDAIESDLTYFTDNIWTEVLKNYHSETAGKKKATNFVAILMQKGPCHQLVSASSFLDALK